LFIGITCEIDGVCARALGLRVTPRAPSVSD